MSKREIICIAASIFAIESSSGMQVVPLGERQIASTNDNVGTMAVRLGTGNIEIPQTEEVRYSSFEFSGDNVIVSFSRGILEGNSFISRDILEKTYPYEREFIGLEQADNNHSFAIYKLFANTQEAGRLELTNRFVDEDVSLEHKKKIIGAPVDDDDALVTRGTVETYVLLDGIERSVRTEANSTIPYVFLKMERDATYFDAPDGGDNVKVYARWNGEEVRRAWDGLALREKPARDPEVAAGAAQGGATSSGNQYSSNAIENVGQHIRDNCNVM